MKSRKLTLLMGGIIIAMAITMVACNDSDESAKDASKKDSMGVSNTTETSIKTKKTGKASISATESKMDSKIEKDNMGYYNFTEVAPIYPGGQSSLEAFINNNIEYPQEAIDHNVEGTVNVQFAIDETGKVSNAKATGTKLGYGLEEEAVKIVSQMPKWTPGQVKGKSVKARYNLPITYKINES